MSKETKKEILSYVLKVAKEAYIEGLCFNRHLHQNYVDRCWNKSNVKKEITEQMVK